MLRVDKYYLVIHIGRVDNLTTEDERGVINSYVTAEWGG